MNKSIWHNPLVHPSSSHPLSDRIHSWLFSYLSKWWLFPHCLHYSSSSSHYPHTFLGGVWGLERVLRRHLCRAIGFLGTAQNMAQSYSLILRAGNWNPKRASDLPKDMELISDSVETRTGTPSGQLHSPLISSYHWLENTKGVGSGWSSFFPNF